MTIHNDTIASVTVIYLENDPSAPVSNRKRALSQPIDACPIDMSFVSSRCIRSRSAQAWSLVCKSPDHGFRRITWGECGSHEICVDGRVFSKPQDGGLMEFAAWCVSQANSIRIYVDAATGQTVPSQVKMGYHPNLAASYSTQAILTDLNGRQMAVAADLGIQAQASRQIGNVPSWGTLLNGVDQCTNCSAVGLMAVPAGTQRITVQARLMPGSESALLFLASVFSAA